MGRVAGDAELTTSSGALRVDRIDGTAVFKNSNGDTRIGEISGELRVSGANGDIVVDRAHAGVVAKTANGDVRIGEVASGAVQAQTARGRVDIGVAEGVSAWLDLETSFGNVQNNLDVDRAAGRRRGHGRDPRPHALSATSRSAARSRATCRGRDDDNGTDGERA